MLLQKPANDDWSDEFSQFVEQSRKASELMKALSHENRLLILCLLRDGERSVSDLEEILGLSQAAASQQLARLRLDGLVKARRDGRMIYYSIASKEVIAVIATLHDLFCKSAAEASTSPSSTR